MWRAFLVSTRCSSSINLALKMPYRLVVAESSAVLKKAVLAAFPLPEFEVHFVKNKQELGAVLEEAQPDAILLSLSLSGKDAYELGRDVRGCQGSGRIPLVLLYGAFEALDKQRLKEVDYDEIIPEPFDSKTLEQTVRALIEGGKDPQTLPEEPALQRGQPEATAALERRLEARIQREIRGLEEKLIQKIVTKVLAEVQRGEDEETEPQDGCE